MLLMLRKLQYYIVNHSNRIAYLVTELVEGTLHTSTVWDKSTSNAARVWKHASKENTNYLSQNAKKSTLKNTTVTL